MKGSLSLQRSNQDEKVISFRLRLDVGKTLTMVMQPADFALMITGMTDVDCDIETRNLTINTGVKSGVRPKPEILAERVAELESEGDMVLVPRGVLGAASSAIDAGREGSMVLALLRHYAKAKG